MYMSYDVDWDWLGTSGRAPRTRETLPDFRESCRVTRHSRVFRGLTGYQRTPGFWGVTITKILFQFFTYAMECYIISNRCIYFFCSPFSGFLVIIYLKRF